MSLIKSSSKNLVFILKGGEGKCNVLTPQVNRAYPCEKKALKLIYPTKKRENRNSLNMSEFFLFLRSLIYCWVMKVFYFSCLLVVLNGLLYAKGNHELDKLFVEAEIFFETEKYDQALPLYLTIESRNYETANINFKIGVCYLFSTYEKAKAIPYLETMMSATVTAKGQITIPKAVRDALGVKPGSKVEFKRLDDGQIAIVKEGARPKNRFDKMRGSAGPGPTTEELMALLRGDD